MAFEAIVTGKYDGYSKILSKNFDVLQKYTNMVRLRIMPNNDGNTDVSFTMEATKTSGNGYVSTTMTIPYDEHPYSVYIGTAGEYYVKASYFYNSNSYEEMTPFHSVR